MRIDVYLKYYDMRNDYILLRVWLLMGCCFVITACVGKKNDAEKRIGAAGSGGIIRDV